MLKKSVGKLRKFVLVVTPFLLCVIAVKGEEGRVPCVRRSGGQREFLEFISAGVKCSRFDKESEDGSYAPIPRIRRSSLLSVRFQPMFALQPQHYVTTVAGIQMPKLIYGTAWKKDRTVDLVTQAVRIGFRGIDTACQPKHYNEAGVGQAIKLLIESQEIKKREELFIQTKFTSLDGQDMNRIPYDRDAPLQEQVAQSLEVSLKNLNTSYIDSLVLHSPMRTFKETLEVWRVFETFVEAGKVLQLGISNCYDLGILTRLYGEAVVKPAVIQNRLYKETNYDQSIRAFAKEKNIFYQSFWTLTANPSILRLPVVKKTAAKYRKTPEQIFFAYLINSAGLTPLTGTTSEVHMKEDLEALDLQLLPSEIEVFDSILNSERGGS